MSRSAAPLARVTQPTKTDVKEKKLHNFTILSQSPYDIFGITSDQGIVFVLDAGTIRSSSTAR